MWPNKFDYARAGSVDEALALITEDGKFLAGGHSLLPVMKLRLDAPEQLVDIGRIAELKGISANGGLTIGAGATHDDIASSTDVQAICSALASACGQVGDQGRAQLRHARRQYRPCRSRSPTRRQCSWLAAPPSISKARTGRVQ